MSKILARWIESAVAGKGVLQNPTTFGLEVEVTTNKGLGFSGATASDTLEVLVNDSTVGFNGSGQLEVKANSIGPAHIDETAAYNFSNTSNVIKAATPSAANDVTTKSYVDSLVSGLSWQEPVDEVNVDDTALTGPVVGGYRVLINGVGLNDFAGEDNKIAVRNSGNTAWSFVTASANWAVFDKQSDNGYTFNADGPAWIQFTGTGSINAGDGLSKTGNTLDVDLAPNKGLEFDTNQLAVKLDTTKGLGFSGYGHVVAKVDGTNIVFSGGNIALDVASLAGAGLADNGTTLDVTTGQGITISSDAVTVKLNTNAGLVKNTGAGTDELAINAGSGLELNSNALRIAASAAGAGLSGGAGSPLAVEVTANKGLGFNTGGDAGTLEVKVDATTIGFTGGGLLEVVDGSIDATKVDLADDYTWTGAHDFTGGSIVATTQAPLDSSTLVATTQYVDDAVAAAVTTSEEARVEYLTLNGTDITNKYKDLTVAPKTASYTCVDVIGAGAQAYTVDFTVITDGSTIKRLNWNGLGLDGTVISGTILRVMYTVDV